MGIRSWPSRLVPACVCCDNSLTLSEKKTDQPDQLVWRTALMAYHTKARGVAHIVLSFSPIQRERLIVVCRGGAPSVERSIPAIRQVDKDLSFFRGAWHKKQGVPTPAMLSVAGCRGQPYIRPLSALGCWVSALQTLSPLLVEHRPSQPASMCVLCLEPLCARPPSSSSTNRVCRSLLLTTFVRTQNISTYLVRAYARPPHIIPKPQHSCCCAGCLLGLGMVARGWRGCACE